MARILVADDERDILDLIAFTLTRAGHEVAAEADGEAALAAARGTHPDLVLLDWMMPRMTGLEVCVALRADRDLADIGIILLTARAQEADLQRGFAAGTGDYLVKPFSPRELVARVTAALGRAPIGSRG